MSKLGIKCPHCGAQTTVIYSTETYGGSAVRRRRRCLSCGEKITTYERYASESRNKDACKE